MYDQQITIDYALNLFQGKFIHVQEIKQLKPHEKTDLHSGFTRLADQLELSLVHLAIIATFDESSIDKLLDLSYSFEGIKSILAAKAVQDYRDTVVSCRFPISGVRSLLRRLGVIDPLKEYYRYVATR
jgi:hypothetical protein